VSTVNHRPTGVDHADTATQLLDAVDRHVADPHTVTVAQVHATLAVADALADITKVLADLHVLTHAGTPAYGGERV
jgi:hypothetical protein